MTTPFQHRWELAMFALLALLMAYSWMSPEISAPNERSRIYLTMSLLESGSLSVDNQVDRFGVPYDIAERDGQYFTDKAPGSSVVALPAMLVYATLGGDTGSIEKLTQVARLGVMLPITVMALVLFRLLVGRLSVGPPLAVAMTAILALGTSLFHYGSAFYGHGIVLFCSLLAAYCLFRNTDGDDTSLHWPLFAGLAGGFAFAVEYQAVLICAGLALGFVMIRRHRSIAPMVAFAVGMAIPVVAVFAYHTVAFGHPLTTSYEFLIHDGPVEKHEAGLWGITIPSWEALYGLLFSPSRGLALCAPVVLAGLAGIAAMWRHSRWLAAYTAVAAVGYLWMATSARDVWFAGWSFGPRLLLPIFGLCALAGAVWWNELRERRPVAASVLLGIFAAAIVYNVFVITMFPEIPPAVDAPLSSIAIPLAEAASPSPNIAMVLFGLDGWTSLIPLGAGVAVVLTFVLWTGYPRRAKQFNLLHPAGVFTGIFLFTVIALGYPEGHSQQRIDDFVDNLTELRVHSEPSD